MNYSGLQFMLAEKKQLTILQNYMYYTYIDPCHLSFSFSWDICKCIYMNQVGKNVETSHALTVERSEKKDH